MTGSLQPPGLCPCSSLCLQCCCLFLLAAHSSKCKCHFFRETYPDLPTSNGTLLFPPSPPSYCLYSYYHNLGRSCHYTCVFIEKVCPALDTEHHEDKDLAFSLWWCYLRNSIHSVHFILFVFVSQRIHWAIRVVSGNQNVALWLKNMEYNILSGRNISNHADSIFTISGKQINYN